MDESSVKESDLIDCYRLAVDFGKSAAEQAMSVINAARNNTETIPPEPDIKPAEQH